MVNKQSLIHTAANYPVRMRKGNRFVRICLSSSGVVVVIVTPKIASLGDLGTFETHKLVK